MTRADDEAVDEVVEPEAEEEGEHRMRRHAGVVVPVAVCVRMRVCVPVAVRVRFVVVRVPAGERLDQVQRQEPAHDRERGRRDVRQLERLFLRHTGVTPLRYYLQIRLDRTRELLLYSDRSVIEIAVSAGFSSTSHFSTWYRRVYGVRPSEMRQEPGVPPKARATRRKS